MIVVSVLEGQILYGVNLSEKGAEIFYISDKEFDNIQSGISQFKDGEVVDYDIENEDKEQKDERKEKEEYDRKKKISENIIAKYSITDQLNLLRRKLVELLPEDTELVECNDFIEGWLKSE